MVNNSSEQVKKKTVNLGEIADKIKTTDDLARFLWKLIEDVVNSAYKGEEFEATGELNGSKFKLSIKIVPEREDIK